MGEIFMHRNFAAFGRRPTLPTAARRRKVHSTPFPPGGENCVRSLAPPLPGEPASLGFAGSNEGDWAKRRRGWTQDGHCVPIFVHTPGPRNGGRPPVWSKQNFRRAKSGVLACNLTRPHWGPGFAKFRIAAVHQLRLGLPSQRSWCKIAFPPQGGRCHDRRS